MSMTIKQIIEAVQTEANKKADTERLNPIRCSQFVTKAIQRIVRRYPGAIKEVHVKDISTFDVAENEYGLDLTELTNTVAGVLRVKYIDATSNRFITLKPYPGGLITWDEAFPYIPFRNSGYAQYYQRRVDELELDRPWNAAAAVNGVLWLYYDKLPPDYYYPVIAASAGGATRTTNVVTITTDAAHGFVVGDSVIVVVTTLASGDSMDGTFTIATVPTTTTFTYASVADDATGGGGSVTILPILTGMEEEIIALGKAFAIGALGPKYQVVARIEKELAYEKINEELSSKSDVEVSPENVYRGP